VERINPNTVDANGLSLLLWAVESGNEEIVKMPLGKDDANSKSINKNGTSLAACGEEAGGSGKDST